MSSSVTIGVSLGNKQKAWLEQLQLVAESWGAKRGLEVAVKGLDLRSLAALEAQELDIVLHKMVKHLALESGDAKLAAQLNSLQQYFDAHPRVPFEPLDAIRVVNDRRALAERLGDFCVETLEGRVRHPPFFAAATLDEARQLAQMDQAMYPFIAKPFVADGVPESHDLGMIVSAKGFLEAPLPYIVQPFFNHGAQIVKVYVLGDIVTQLRRPSLPNVAQRGPLPGEPGYRPFGRISNAREEPKVLPDDEGDVPLVPDGLVRAAVKQLGSVLNLRLFGVDLIRDEETGDFLIVDINYLPGYYGVANVFEALLDLLHSEMVKRRESTALQRGQAGEQVVE